MRESISQPLTRNTHHQPRKQKIRQCTFECGVRLLSPHIELTQQIICYMIITHSHSILLSHCQSLSPCSLYCISLSLSHSPSLYCSTLSCTLPLSHALTWLFLSLSLSHSLALLLLFSHSHTLELPPSLELTLSFNSRRTSTIPLFLAYSLQLIHYRRVLWKSLGIRRKTRKLFRLRSQVRRL